MLFGTASKKKVIADLLFAPHVTSRIFWNDAFRATFETGRGQMIRLFEIRNAFAHDIMTDFLNPKIAGLVDRFVSLRFEGNTDFILEMPTENPQSAHRQKFSFICMTMSIELQWREIDVLKYSQNLESLQDDGGTIPFLDYNENASS